MTEIDCTHCEGVGHTLALTGIRSNGSTWYENYEEVTCEYCKGVGYISEFEHYKYFVKKED